MKNILAINGKSYDIDSYEDFEAILRAQLETIKENFNIYDKFTQEKVLLAFYVSTLKELNKVNILNFDLDTIMNTIENLGIDYSYSGIDFDGRINSWYIGGIML